MAKFFELASVRNVQLLFLSVVASVALGCALSSPIIVNPPEGWEEEAERGMMRSEARPTPKPHVAPEEASGAVVATEKKHNPVVTALADIIGYPFRAVGYLARVLL